MIIDFNIRLLDNGDMTYNVDATAWTGQDCVGRKTIENVGWRTALNIIRAWSLSTRARVDPPVDQPRPDKQLPLFGDYTHPFE